MSTVGYIFVCSFLIAVASSSFLYSISENAGRGVAVIIGSVMISILIGVIKEWWHN